MLLPDARFDAQLHGWTNIRDGEIQWSIDVEKREAVTTVTIYGIPPEETTTA